MKKLLPIGIVSLFLCLTAFPGLPQPGRQDSTGNDGSRDRFIGGWRLAWLEQQGADGKIHRIDCCGLFVFTRDGHMSVQVMQREPQAQTPAGPEQYSQGGYEATHGTYQVDEATHTFTIHVDGSLVRALVGKDLRRSYEFSGKQLIVKSTRPDEHWRVGWEHY